MFTVGKRAKYTCEILDGGSKAIFQITSSEDPDNPIRKDTPTAAWVLPHTHPQIVVCTAVNNISPIKRQSVTISGPERFGLSDPLVVSLIQELPDAEKFAKYAFK